VESVTVARAEPTEAKKKAGLKQEVDRVEVFTSQAREAERAGDYGRATAYLKEAVAAATGDRRTDLLEEWCRVSLKMDTETDTDTEPCALLRPQRPNSASFQVIANRRSKRAPMLDMEAPAKADKAQPRPARAAPPPAASQQSAQ
jgi:hypothetical protein